MGRLDGRTAIVTGAAQGIGATYAKAMAEEGANVVVADLLDPSTTVNIIKQAGGSAIGTRTDVTDSAAVADMVARAEDAFGKVDVLVTNAALFGDLEQKSFLDIDENEWDRVMKVNLRGVFQCIKAVAPGMKKRKYGKIINIASGTVFKGTPNLLHYVTSKGGIIAMTRVLARELGDDNICVNAIAPGLTMSEKVIGGMYDAEMIRANYQTRAFKREETPDDLIGALLFLSSADSDFMTGQTMVIDGGSALH